MPIRTTKRCTRCTTTFTTATCPNKCPRRHTRWSVLEDTKIDGKRRRRTIGTYSNQRDAEAARVEAEDNDRRGNAVVSSDITLAEWTEQWLGTQAHRYAPTTIGTIQSGFTQWLLPALGDRRLRDLTPIHFDKLYIDMAHRLRPVTIQGYARGWHSMFNDATKRHLLVRNPMDGTQTPKVEAKHPDLLTPHDVTNVLGLLTRERHGLVFRCLIVTGARRGEVLGLTWNDIDLEGEQPVARIRRSLTSTMVGLRIGAPKTASSVRTVALDPTTTDLLRELRQQHRHEAMRIGREAWTEAGTVTDRSGTPQALDLVFRRDDGRPLEPSRVTYWWRSFLKRYGFDHVKLHSLRHAWASVAIENGVPMKVVQQQLGHSNITTTLNIYSHVSEQAQAEATATVMEQFGS